MITDLSINQSIVRHFKFTLLLLVLFVCVCARSFGADIPNALAYLKEHYDIGRVQEMCGMFVKIITNILQHPQEVQYRKINTTSAKFEVSL